MLSEENKKLLLREKEEKEQLVKKKEEIIRNSLDEHEKKMHDVAKFNRLHEKAKQNQDTYNKGPSESRVAELKKEKMELFKKTKKFEGEFIKKQSQLIAKEIKCSEISENIINIKRKEIVLEQKKIRLDKEYQDYLKEIKSFETSLKNYEKEMNKLNDFLALFSDKKGVMENKNKNITKDFGEKLKEIERISGQLELKIDQLRENKSELLGQIMECERQNFLWERKIQLEKEMQEALNPNIAKEELKFLKKELHIMNLKFNDIKKK
jgi:chromosome segregation ATPase